MSVLSQNITSLLAQSLLQVLQLTSGNEIKIGYGVTLFAKALHI